MRRAKPADLACQGDLVSALASIFPEFAKVWEEDNPDDVCRSDSQHGVYLSFLPFLVRVRWNSAQLTQLAWLLSDAVAAGGVAGNAVETAFLEAISARDELGRQLKPLLDPRAKSYLR